MRRPLLVLALPFVLILGCSESDETPYQSAKPDGGTADGASEASVDGSADASTQDVHDAGWDTATDAATDTAQDATVIDSAVDSGSDAPTVEVGPDGSCPGVSAAGDVDPFAMRSAAAGFGGLETKTAGGHTDVFLRSPTDYIRIGVRLDWGGTVVFYGLTDNPASNVIDANDTGRELQVALYDPTRMHQPCAWNASCQPGPSSCGNSITFLGWNPVQGGDECNRGAPVLSHGAVGDALEVVIQPLQWNPDWDRPDCTQSSCGPTGRTVDVTYRMQYRFLTEHVVEIAMEVSSQETFDHPVTGQEWPTLYVSHGKGGPDLPTLLDSAGKAISITTPANDGFFYTNFTSPSPWVSFQNLDKTYGVGLGMDQGTQGFQGWHGNGVTAPYFHNVRAQIAFGLDAGSVVRGVAYLALGAFGGVKSELDSVLAARAPFGHVDEPAGGAVVTYAPGAPITLRGWALDNTPGTTIRAEVDGITLATLTPQGSRLDVCKVYPGYPTCPNVGFEGSIPTTSLDGCAHLLRVVATDSNGNERVLGERVIAPN
jgi:hypothetical protein